MHLQLPTRAKFSLIAGLQIQIWPNEFGYQLSVTDTAFVIGTQGGVRNYYVTMSQRTVNTRFFASDRQRCDKNEKRVRQTDINRGNRNGGIRTSATVHRLCALPDQQLYCRTNATSQSLLRDDHIAPTMVNERKITHLIGAQPV